MNSFNDDATIENRDLDYDIEIFNLSKIYKIKGKSNTITALKNINLKVKKGEIFGLLGPNGAGKTTMVSILTTLIQPTTGYANILGQNILKKAWYIKENIGLMLGPSMIYNRITGYNNLKFYAKIYGVKNFKQKIYDLAELFDLTDWLNIYVEKYSSGMKTKLALARVLLSEPKLLFLDEPLVGLDPNIVKKIISILRGLNITIFLTSHQMNIVQKLCKRIAFLKEGEIIKVDKNDNFRKVVSEKILLKIKVTEKIDELIKLFNNLEYIDDVKRNKNELSFSIQNENYYSKLFNNLKGFNVINFTSIEPSLEEVFYKLSK